MNFRIYIISILMIILMFQAEGQSRWVKAYYDDEDAYGSYFIESYDHGYLVLGKHGHNYIHYNWLIKTDVNGEKLWEKTIGDANSYITILNMDMNEGGGLFCAGITNYYDAYRDPIIIKLDSCGEKEWCRVFYTPGNMNFSNFVITTNDGGCVAILMYTGDNPYGQTDRICLAKLSSEGELLWEQCYNSPDTNLIGEDANHLINTHDHGYLISGHCYYLDPNNPNLYWLKPYYINTDSLGNFQWETVVHKEVSNIGGIGRTTTLNLNQSYYYSSIKHYYYNPSSTAPAIVKMDLNGNVLDIYDIVSGYENGGLGYATFLNDTILAASAGWGNDEEDIVSYAVILDTLGNLLDSTVLVEDIYRSILQVTFDGKLVYMYNTYQNSQFDVYLRKLNQNLEDDTLYTFPFIYDSLCPYSIVSDTIVQDDCGLIVGMEEVKPDKEEESSGIIIYPNPAQNIINIQYPITNGGCRSIISIYGVFGRKVKEIKLSKGQQQLKVNVSNWHNGLYIAVLKDDKKFITKQKFVVLR